MLVLASAESDELARRQKQNKSLFPLYWARNIRNNLFQRRICK